MIIHERFFRVFSKRCTAYCENFWTGEWVN